MVDLLNLQPTTISRDLRSKYLLIYSQPKAGKTSFAASLPNNLIFSFEIGTNALSGIYALPITKWSELKLAVKQLEKPEVQAKFHTVTFDTVGIAYGLCEKYICAQNGVQSISDIPWGRGYAMVKQEFEETLRKISMMGLGIILIAHSSRRVEKQSDDSEIEFFSPDLDKRCYSIVNQLVDIIGYIDVRFKEDGTSERFLYTRRTPTVMAGSRWKYLDPVIPFGYQELVDAIGRAIERSEKDDGAVVVDNRTPVIQEERSFEEVEAEARELWGKAVSKDERNAERIMEIVEKVFGQKMKLSNITPAQKDLYEVVVAEMRDLV
jgi:hypothetical protein